MDHITGYIRAQNELSVLRSVLAEREGRIITRLVAQVDHGTLSSDEARDGIVAIAALRALVRDAEKRYRLSAAELPAEQ